MYQSIYLSIFYLSICPCVRIIYLPQVHVLCMYGVLKGAKSIYLHIYILYKLYKPHY